MAKSLLSAIGSPILLCIAVQLLFLTPSLSADKSTLMAGETLLAGNSLTNGEYTLTMQEDCNAVLKHGENITWESKTAGMGSKCFLYMQVNGELVVYSEGTSKFVWKSGKGQPVVRSMLALQSDGNAVVFGTATWSTGYLG